MSARLKRVSCIGRTTDAAAVIKLQLLYRFPLRIVVLTEASCLFDKWCMFCSRLGHKDDMLSALQVKLLPSTTTHCSAAKPVMALSTAATNNPTPLCSDALESRCTQTARPCHQAACPDRAFRLLYRPSVSTQFPPVKQCTQTTSPAR